MGSVEVGGNGSIDWRIDHEDPKKTDIVVKGDNAMGRDPVPSRETQPPGGPKGHFRLDVIFNTAMEAKAALETASVQGTAIVLFVRANSEKAEKYQAPAQFAINW
jgi:hypothetical protein